jgi:hypothetical protein
MTSPEELERAKKYLENLKNAGNLPLLSKTAQTESVRLLADESVSPAMFKPHHSLPNTFFANQLTIRAVKRDLFMGGEGFDDLQKIVPCKACNRDIDQQFWSMCPYCEGNLSK